VIWVEVAELISVGAAKVIGLAGAEVIAGLGPTIGGSVVTAIRIGYARSPSQGCRS